MTKPNPLHLDSCRVIHVGIEDYVYVPITKVSSTFLRKSLATPAFNLYDWQWTDPSKKHQLPDREHCQFLIVLRDPTERWISGAAHYWSQHQFEHVKNWFDRPLESLDWLSKQVEFDDHTRPQVEFLQGVDRNRVTWIRYQPDMSIHTWFRDHNVILTPVPDPDRNITDLNPGFWFDNKGVGFEEYRPGLRSGCTPKQIKQRLRSLLDDDIIRLDRIRNYYWRDYELIHSVNFYGSN